MNGKHLIFFVGAYNTLDLFSNELEREFQSFGYETMQYDISHPEESLKRLSSFLQKPVTAVITFNNLGCNMQLVPGYNVWDQFGIFCINILVDHPSFYKPGLDAAPRLSAVLCIDQNHMRYMQRFYPSIPITGFLPHGGSDRSPAGPKPIRERTVDVLYAGGLSKNFLNNIMPDFSKYKDFDAKSIADAAYGLLIAHPEKTGEAAIEEVLAANGICLPDEQLCGLISDLRYVEGLAVSYYREAAVRTLVEHGIHVALYGNGWENCEWIDSPFVTCHQQVPMEEILDIMQDSKIVLNTMTWFKAGAHERIFDGMLAGAVVVTDSSQYLKEEFSNDEFVMFELTEIDCLAQTVTGLLQHPDQMQAIADRGLSAAKERHTWGHRACELESDLISTLTPDLANADAPADLAGAAYQAPSSWDMQIAVSTDLKYARYLYVMLVSLFENNRQRPITVWLLTADLTDKDEYGRAFHALAEQYGNTLHILLIDRTTLPADVPSSNEFPLEVYFRLALPDLLPPEADRVLYLDADIIVHGSLDELYDMDFAGHSLVACHDMAAMSNEYAKVSPLFSAFSDTEDFVYFNSGVLLMNLKKMRSHGTTFSFFVQKAAELKEQLIFFDQDLLNMVYYKDTLFADHILYNLPAYGVYHAGVSYETVKERNIILHYTGVKPWDHKRPRHPLELFWWDYARLTPYYTGLLEDVVLGEVHSGYLEQKLVSLEQINAEALALLKKLSTR